MLNRPENKIKALGCGSLFAVYFVIRIIIAIVNQYSSNKSEEIEAYLKQSERQAQAGQFSSAIKTLDECTSKYKNYMCWAVKGSYHLSAGNNYDALYSVDKAIGVDSNQWTAWYLRAVVCRNLNMYTESAEAYQKAKDLNPDTPSID